MKFICLCEEEFEVEGVNTILPKHKKQTGELCPASKKSVKKACLIEPAPDCPLTMGHAYCAFCHTRPCLAEKKGVWP
ncbi:MAG: hypothetical protein WC619_02560 [Patescibacteria group bacterium]